METVEFEENWINVNIINGRNTTRYVSSNAYDKDDSVRKYMVLWIKQIISKLRKKIPNLLKNCGNQLATAWNLFGNIKKLNNNNLKMKTVILKK